MQEEALVDLLSVFVSCCARRSPLLKNDLTKQQKIFLRGGVPLYRECGDSRSIGQVSVFWSITPHNVYIRW